LCKICIIKINHTVRPVVNRPDWDAIGLYNIRLYNMAAMAMLYSIRI